MNMAQGCTHFVLILCPKQGTIFEFIPAPGEKDTSLLLTYSGFLCIPLGNRVSCQPLNTLSESSKDLITTQMRQDCHGDSGVKLTIILNVVLTESVTADRQLFKSDTNWLNVQGI